MYFKPRKQGARLVRWSPIRFCKPRMLLVIALILCWDGENQSHANSHQYQKNWRLGAPSNYDCPQKLQGTIQQEEIGSVVPGPDETAFSGGGGSLIENLAEDNVMPPRQKKDCSGMPSIATRGLVGPSLKRSYFATSKEEIEEKMQEENNREKREINRAEPTTEPTTEPTPLLPWTCETNHEWHDMGPDHYPRFIRTAECKSRSCFNGFFRCRARRYKTNVLKRVSASDSTSCEEDDTSLPETLRSNWKFISVSFTLCCDCSR